ncbi:hypothetical protein CLV90_1394 [Maribacter spongiicola]|uniref:Uncharacterized protein n=1 Tax=Maribacter spongiicola TaxID=1206753 RepID=A0A4R7K8P5_9FLAO|nr:hypothetical protein CLV90_1394 [Maribacter spongiicola]
MSNLLQNTNTTLSSTLPFLDSMFYNLIYKNNYLEI